MENMSSGDEVLENLLSCECRQRAIDRFNKGPEYAKEFFNDCENIDARTRELIGREEDPEILRRISRGQVFAMAEESYLKGRHERIPRLAKMLAINDPLISEMDFFLNLAGISYPTLCGNTSKLLTLEEVDNSLFSCFQRDGNQDLHYASAPGLAVYATLNSRYAGGVHWNTINIVEVEKQDSELKAMTFSLRSSLLKGEGGRKEAVADATEMLAKEKITNFCAFKVPDITIISYLLHRYSTKTTSDFLRQHATDLLENLN
jgi:hypothetical protein